MSVSPEEVPSVSEDEEGPAMSQEQVEGLRNSAAEISRELKALSSQVASLMAAVESLSPPQPTAPVVKPTTEPAPQPEEVDDGLEMTVTVSPLPELAMAAVAETTLRGLPGVRQVKVVKREGDWARFTLDVDPGTDLVTQMKAAMPVAFKVEEATEDSVSLALQWAWGTS
ncbi:MAG: hypothetical protein IPK93_07670 [Solirubrobacterales bacterium]|nr:hypothetical protein [Solirubrobacterales bacterium]